MDYYPAIQEERVVVQVSHKANRLGHLWGMLLLQKLLQRF